MSDFCFGDILFFRKKMYSNLTITVSRVVCFITILVSSATTWANGNNQGKACVEIVSGRSSSTVSRPEPRRQAQGDLVATEVSHLTKSSQPSQKKANIDQVIINLIESMQLETMISTFKQIDNSISTGKPTRWVNGADYLLKNQLILIDEKLMALSENFTFKDFANVAHYFLNQPQYFEKYVQMALRRADGSMAKLPATELTEVGRLLFTAVSDDQFEVPKNWQSEWLSAVGPLMDQMNHIQLNRVLANLAVFEELPPTEWTDHMVQVLVERSNKFGESDQLGKAEVVGLKVRMIQQRSDFSVNAWNAFENYFLDFAENASNRRQLFIKVLQAAKSNNQTVHLRLLKALEKAIEDDYTKDVRMLHAGSRLFEALLEYGYKPNTMFFAYWEQALTDFVLKNNDVGYAALQQYIAIFNGFAAAGVMPSDNFLRGFDSAISKFSRKIKDDQVIFQIYLGIFNLQAYESFPKSLNWLKSHIAYWKAIPRELQPALKTIAIYEKVFMADTYLSDRLDFSDETLIDSQISLLETEQAKSELTKKMPVGVGEVQLNYLVSSGQLASFYLPSRRIIGFFDKSENYLFSEDGSAELKPFLKRVDELHQEMGFSTIRAKLQVSVSNSN